MNNELYHHGIIGMKWGVRRFQNADGTLTEAGQRRYTQSSGNGIRDIATRHTAKKDAKEFARAKMYYGDGAGTRRKLIKAKVNQRSKNDPVYREAYERAYAQQDMAKHSNAAKRERKISDAKDATARTARGVFHLVMHDGAAITASAAIVYAAARATGMDKKMVEWGRTAASTAVNYGKNLRNKMERERILRGMGIK